MMQKPLSGLLLIIFTATLGATRMPHAEAATLATSAPGTTVLACAQDSTQALPIGMLLNNMWNRKSAGPGPWRQCLQSRQRDGHTEYGWFWEWPGRDGLYAYPEMLVGRSPWQPRPSNDPRFPRQVSKTRALHIDYEVESQSTGKKNLAVEFWFTGTPPASGQQDTASIKTELMIWSDASDDIGAPSQNPAITVDIDGQTWAVEIQHGWGDATGGTGSRWSLITYCAMKNASTARYDARKFFDDAIARGLIKPSDYLWGVELGNEIISGRGTTWIRRFQLHLE